MTVFEQRFDDESLFRFLTTYRGRRRPSSEHVALEMYAERPSFPSEKPSWCSCTSKDQ